MVLSFLLIYTPVSCWGVLTVMQARNLYNYIIFITKYWGGQTILRPPLVKNWVTSCPSPLKLGPWRFLKTSLVTSYFDVSNNRVSFSFTLLWIVACICSHVSVKICSINLFPLNVFFLHVGMETPRFGLWLIDGILWKNENFLVINVYANSKFLILVFEPQNNNNCFSQSTRYQFTSLSHCN